MKKMKNKKFDCEMVGTEARRRVEGGSQKSGLLFEPRTAKSSRSSRPMAPRRRPRTQVPNQTTLRTKAGAVAAGEPRASSPNGHSLNLATRP